MLSAALESELRVRVGVGVGAEKGGIRLIYPHGHRSDRLARPTASRYLLPHNSQERPRDAGGFNCEEKSFNLLNF
jgi:hypothetical protein